MKLNSLYIKSILIAILIFSSQVSALTVSEFKAICKSSLVECKEHPLLQAYVGGALDVLVVLKEETQYLEKIYCEDTSVLFNFKKIITFMEQSQEKATNNAMLVLVKYLERNSGC